MSKKKPAIASKQTSPYRIITASDIATYTRCPKKSQFLWNNYEQGKIFSIDASIIIDIIKFAFIYRTRKEQDASWKSISLYSEKAIMRAKETFLTPQDRYKESKDILTRIRRWYLDYYNSDLIGPGLINVPIRIKLGNNYIFQDNIDILEIGEKISIIDFSEIKGVKNAPSAVSIYNDLLNQIRIWGVSRAIERPIGAYIKCIIGPQTIKTTKLNVTDITLNKTNIMLNYVVEGIVREVFYPARSEQCNTCPFYSQCSF